jgi:hypothetical protein
LARDRPLKTWIDRVAQNDSEFCHRNKEVSADSDSSSPGSDACLKVVEGKVLQQRLGDGDAPGRVPDVVEPRGPDGDAADVGDDDEHAAYARMVQCTCRKRQRTVASESAFLGMCGRGGRGAPRYPRGAEEPLGRGGKHACTHARTHTHARAHTHTHTHTHTSKVAGMHMCTRKDYHYTKGRPGVCKTLYCTGRLRLTWPAPRCRTPTAQSSRTFQVPSFFGEWRRQGGFACLATHTHHEGPHVRPHWMWWRKPSRANKVKKNTVSYMSCVGTLLSVIIPSFSMCHGQPTV